MNTYLCSWPYEEKINLTNRIRIKMEQNNITEEKKFRIHLFMIILSQLFII